MSKVQGPRRRKVATPAPRVQRKRKEPAVPSRFEIRARAQTAILRNPGMTLRELSEAIGQPYVVVRDVLLGDTPVSTGLSQFRWPDLPDEEVAC